MAYIRVLVATICIVLTGLCVAGERNFSWTAAPQNYIAISLASYSLGKYLSDCQVNRPEILNEVKMALQSGKYYDKRTNDQRSRSARITVWVDSDYMLHIKTVREDDCPTCNGTGTRANPLGEQKKIRIQIGVRLRCLDCDGTGKLPNNTTEKYYVLSSEDFEKVEEGREIMSRKAFSNAPMGAAAWVEKLSSQNPAERLSACLWLDQHYVQKGTFFQDIMPMLKKARYYDSNEKKKLMVWQFWAGKDIPNEKQRAYYRIYADSKTGKITEKGFFAGR